MIIRKAHIITRPNVMQWNQIVLELMECLF